MAQPKQLDEATTKTYMRNQLSEYKSQYVDPKTDEVNMTLLAESTIDEFDRRGYKVYDEEDYPLEVIYDWALEVSEGYH